MDGGNSCKVLARSSAPISVRQMAGRGGTEGRGSWVESCAVEAGEDLHGCGSAATSSARVGKECPRRESAVSTVNYSRSAAQRSAAQHTLEVDGKRGRTMQTADAETLGSQALQPWSRNKGP